MINNRYREHNISKNRSEAWVRDVLEPDQLSTAKHPVGRLALTGKTIVLLWGLRVYVVFMVLLIAFQIWNALHAGS